MCNICVGMQRSWPFLTPQLGLLVLTGVEDGGPAQKHFTKERAQSPPIDGATVARPLTLEEELRCKHAWLG